MLQQILLLLLSLSSGSISHCKDHFFPDFVLFLERKTIEDCHGRKILGKTIIKVTISYGLTENPHRNC